MANDAPQVSVDPAARAKPAPLPGTNLVQVRARVDSDSAAPPGSTIWIQQINMHAEFDRQVDAGHAHLPRDIPRSAGCWPAPWPWQARAAAAYQLVQPGTWGPGTEIQAGPQRLGLEIVLEWQGADGVPHTESVTQFSGGRPSFDLDWQAPRDYTLDVAVVDEDGQRRMAATLV